MKSTNFKFIFGLILIAALLAGFLFAMPGSEQPGNADSMGLNGYTGVDIADLGGYSVATIGGGCFWCVEAVYEPIDGVVHAISGYSGGEEENPNYRLVSSGTSRHAEVVQLYYDPEKVSYEQIIKLFFKAHDPTTLNRQGFDVGAQYRSIILTHDEEQAAIARKVMDEAQEEWPDPIVTEIVAFEAFYPAEDYHQDFYERNPDYGYCAAIIRPKMEKLGLEGLETIDILDLDL
jgi:methionine-S-sulfoxide reductase